MSAYKAIEGYTVQSLASDPSASADTEGQMWYNSTSNVWKAVVATNGGYSVVTITTS